MVRPGIDPFFDKIFMVGDHLYWYMPLNAYRLYSRPCSKTVFALRRVLYYFVLVSLVVLLYLYFRNFMNAILDGNFLVGLSIIVWFILAINAFQLMIFTWNASPDLIELLQLMHDDFPKTPEERTRMDMENVVKDWQRHMGILVNMYKLTVSGFCAAPMLISVVKYFIDGIWINQLPIYLWFPFDPLVMPIYPFVFVAVIWLFYLNCFIVMANSVVFGEFTMVVCMQFKSVAINCQKLQFTGKFASDLRAVEAIIKEHNRALFIADRMQNLFSFNLLIIYTTAALIFCIFLFLVQNESSLILAWQYLYSLVAYFSYQYVFAYFGDQMIVNVSNFRIEGRVS